MKKFLDFALFYLLLCLPALAITSGLSINADNVTYEKDNNIVDARGSVEVKYKNLVIMGDHIIYNKETEKVSADNGFVLYLKGITLEGRSINCDLTREAGTAQDIYFSYQGVYLKGQTVKFSPENFDLKNASFTTCDFDKPHYHLSASDITLYPSYGWVVAYWGWFWLESYPLLPVPTYIYDVYAQQRHRKNLPPFPEIYSDDEDGLAVKESFVWYNKREWNGIYSLSYAAKKGPGLGVEANYILNDENEGNMRLYANPTDGPYGGITHNYYFGQEIVKENQPELSFLKLPKERQMELETTLSYRERINYQKVSFYPKIVFKSKKSQFFVDQLDYDLDLRAASVSEDNNVSLKQGGGKLVISYPFEALPLGTLVPFLGSEADFYSSGTKWIKNSGGINLDKTLAQNLSASLGYLHYFSVSGLSPFNFEMYRFSSSDRLQGSLLYLSQGSGVGLSASYFVDTWRPEDIDYALYLGMHCYNIIITYRSLRNEFNLGFSLLGE